MTDVINFDILVSLTLRICLGWDRFLQRVIQLNVPINLKTLEIQESSSVSCSWTEDILADFLNAFKGLEELYISHVGPVPGLDFWNRIIHRHTTLRRFVHHQRTIDIDDEGKAAFRSDEIGDAGRLIDLVRSASSAGQITAGSKELADVMQRLSHFQQSALCSQDELRASRSAEGGKRRVGEGLAHLEGVDIPSQAQVRGIKSQQKSASKEVESLVQGTQRRSRKVEECATASWQRQDVVGLVEEVEMVQCPTVGPAVNLEWRASDSFYAEGERISEAFTLNTRQCAALLLICRHLDGIQHVQRESDVDQLCQFIGGEGGTGKSRIIEAIVELFTRRDVEHRLLVTATSGTAAARINGITIHSACNLSVEQRSASTVSKRLDGVQASGPGPRFVSGQSRMHWQDKQLLIIDEVSMLGARTLFAVNEQLQSLRGSPRDFGGIPIVLFCGDFHQFRPVSSPRRRSLLPYGRIVRMSSGRRDWGV